MTPSVTILGAGMAGLIAGHMLRRFFPTIVEASPEIPNNHSALLRFRSDAVANATAIPFRKVRVRKGVKGKHGNEIYSSASIPDINAYAHKVSGVVHDRSITSLDSCDRWVAPENFIGKLAESCPGTLQLSRPFTELSLYAQRDLFRERGGVVVSTLPMPVMMQLVGYNQGETKFVHREITTIVADIEAPLTCVYQTVYLPHRETWGDFYRASIHAGQLIIEGIGKGAQPDFQEFESDIDIARQALTYLFGIERARIKKCERKVQKFGKMVPVDEQERKRFILHLTEEYGIYSLGRYATWRPLLLDDVVQDVKVIERLMLSDSYTRKSH